MVEKPVEEPEEHRPEEAPAAPFDDAPHDPAALKGCSRPVLIGCSVTILVGALLFLLLIVKARDLFLWAFNTNATQILERLPPEVTDEEEERLRRALDAASAAVVDGRIDMEGLQDLQGALALAGKPSISREDVLRAIDALERVAGASEPVEPDAGERAPPVAAST